MHFGSTLKLLRVDAGLSVRALARQIGVSSAYLSRIENGHDPAPTPERLYAIAEALQVPRDMLVELAQQTGPALSGYIQRVPAASAFFLDIARRNLDAAELAQLRQIMDQKFPPPDSPPEGTAPLSSLIGSRIVVGLACDRIDDVIDVGTARCMTGGRGRVEAVARLVREREAVLPTTLGNGVAVPHAVAPGTRTRAALVTLSHPLFYDTPDGTPVEVVVVLVSGAAGREHLEALAQVALLARHGIAGALRDAKTPRQAMSVVKRLEVK